MQEREVCMKGPSSQVVELEKPKRTKEEIEKIKNNHAIGGSYNKVAPCAYRIFKYMTCDNWGYESNCHTDPQKVVEADFKRTLVNAHDNPRGVIVYSHIVINYAKGRIVDNYIEIKGKVDNTVMERIYQGYYTCHAIIVKQVRMWLNGDWMKSRSVQRSLKILESVNLNIQKTIDHTIDYFTDVEEK